MTRCRIVCAVALALALPCGARLAAQVPPPRFWVQVLDSPGNPFAYPLERATAINESGEATGVVMFGYDNLAAYWSPDGRLTSLGTVGERLWSIGCDISDAGMVVGVCLGGSSGVPYLPFLWTEDTGMVGFELGAPATFLAINRQGTVLGVFEDGPPTWSIRPFLWSPSRGVEPLLDNLGGDETYLQDLNDRGEVTGGAETALGVLHAFRWTQQGGMVDLGVLHGHDRSMGHAIGADGTVVGRCWVLSPDRQRATVWRPGVDAPIALPFARSDSDYASANGLNDRGWIVGNEYRYAEGFGTSTGVVWVKGAAFELDELLVPPTSLKRVHVLLASDVNDSGQIVGIGVVDGRQRAIRLDPLTPMRGPWVER